MEYRDIHPVGQNLCPRKEGMIVDLQSLYNDRHILSQDLSHCLLLMVFCIIQVVVYLARSMVPAFVRGRQVERTRSFGEPSGYTLNSEFETPYTVANNVKPLKPERPWHGANEEDILAMMRLQKERCRLRHAIAVKNVEGPVL